MFYRYDLRPQSVDPMSEVDPAAEPLLKRSLFLRYDRSHAGASRSDDAQRSAEGPTATGEADMEVTGPGSVGEEESGRPAECLSSDTAPETIPGLELSGDEDNNAEVARVPKRVSDDPVQRSARLARIQAEIEAGTYESPEKLEIAVERLLREIG